MADTFTNNLRLILQTDQANVNQWGSLFNRSVTDLVEQVIAGSFSADVTATNVALTTVNGFPDTQRPMFIKAVGNPGIEREVVVPTLDKLYIFRNETSPGFDVEIKTTLNSGVVVPSGNQTMVWVDATDDQVRAIGAAGTTVAPGLAYLQVTPTILNNSAGDTTVTIDYFTQGNLVFVGLRPFSTTVADTVFELDFTGVGGVPAALIPGEATSPDRIRSCFVIEGGVLVDEMYLQVPPADANWEFLKADGTAWTNPSTRVLSGDISMVWQTITD